jgi:hypothetical protein
MSSFDPPQGPPQGPPSGPPGGPPPGAAQGADGPPLEPTATNGDGNGDTRRRNLIVIGIAALLVVVLIAVAMSSRGSGGKKDASTPGASEVFLEAAADPGANPFTESVAADMPSTTLPAEPVTIGGGVTAPPIPSPNTAPAAGITSYRGGVPGLYGGTRDNASCDVDRMADFLAANPTKARAWAEVQGIAVDDVPNFVRSLTPVVLRSDTRVTNYGYANGVATPHQSVLQAGTAVLVDQYGEPQAKCACGNPLNPPTPTATPVYQGTPWPRFTPGGVTVVVKNTTIIKVITIIDIRNGTPYGRPTGPNPGPDQPLPKGPPDTTPGNGSGSTSSSGGCDGETFTLVQTLTVPTSDSAVATQAFDAAQCVRFVASGEVDLNNSNSFSGGFDAVYCYDPQYCDPAKPTVQWMGGRTIAEALSLPVPGRSSSHTYSFTFRQPVGGTWTFNLKDVEYSDNVGSLTVKVYTSGGSGTPGSAAGAVKYQGTAGGTIGCISCDGQSRFLSLDDNRVAVGDAAGAAIAKTWATAGRVVSFRATLHTSANKGRYGIAVFRNGDATYLAGCAVEIGQTSCSSDTRGAPMRPGDKITIIVGESGPDPGNFVIDWSFDFKPDS